MKRAIKGLAAAWTIALVTAGAASRPQALEQNEERQRNREEMRQALQERINESRIQREREEQARENLWQARAPRTCTVLDAVPSARIVADAESFQREVHFRPDERTTIVRYGQEYFWASREHRKVLYKVSGWYRYFIEPESASFVKVLDYDSWPDLRERLVGAPSEGFDFMENVTIRLTSHTYWGRAEAFEPDCRPER